MDVTRTLIITPIIIIIIPIGVEVVQAHSETSFFNKINTLIITTKRTTNTKVLFSLVQVSSHAPPREYSGLSVSMTTPHFPFEVWLLG